MIAGAGVSAAATARIRRLRRALLALSVLLAAYLFDMQVVRGDEFRRLADLNSLKRLVLRGPRGIIRDREGRVVVKNRPAFAAAVRLDLVRSPEETIRRARSVLVLEPVVVERLRERLRRRSRPEELVKQDLSLAEVAALKARAHEWPEFSVQESLVRRYPRACAAAHALGHMGEISDAQLSEPSFRSYAAGQVIGQSGLEARYERYLRGRDGFRFAVVDSRGRVTGVLDRIDPPVAGLDLRLTLDLDVQEAAESAFGERRGAAVAIDNRSGAILALVSRPAYDPNAFAGKVSGESWRRYANDPFHPLFDRALLGKTAPGSVFKIVDAVAGLEGGAWNPEERITCRGATVLHGDLFRCWKAGGHGPVDLHEAIRGSCNVYFYHRGSALGIDRLARVARSLGLGERTGIDLDQEGQGLVPDTLWKRRERGEPWWPGETVSVAIGQGALSVSVLQVAQMIEVIANGGVAHVPYLVERVGSSVHRRAPQVSRQVRLKPDTLRRLRAGLRAVVNEPHGTGGRARIDGYAVSGKTGTAQAPPQPGDPDGAKEHAWFAGYAPGDDPVAVVVVLVERVGHGGEFAAPIARAILERILEKEGLKAPEQPGPSVASLDPSEGAGLASPRLGSRFIGPPALGASRRVDPAVIPAGAPGRSLIAARSVARPQPPQAGSAPR